MCTPSVLTLPALNHAPAAASARLLPKFWAPEPTIGQAPELANVAFQASPSRCVIVCFSRQPNGHALAVSQLHRPNDAGNDSVTLLASQTGRHKSRPPRVHTSASLGDVSLRFSSYDSSKRVRIVINPLNLHRLARRSPSPSKSRYNS